MAKQKKEYILQTNLLTKQFKNYKAVDQVSLHVGRGQIYGFIGRNGAGKTTFLKMVGGLAAPTSGDLSLFGYQGSELKHVFSRVGALIEAPGLYDKMTAYDNLKMKCICAGIREKGYVEELLELVGLGDAGKKHTKNFSMGMKQRLGIALALVGEPDLLVLDEPINGLDPQGIVEVRDTILRLNHERNMTILISSHILEELSKIATNYGIIHNGRLIREMTSEQLLESCQERIEVQLNQPEQACTVLEEIGIRNYQVVDGTTIHIYEALQDSSRITMELSKRNIPIQGIGVNSEDLETYFLNLTGGAANA